MARYRIVNAEIRSIALAKIGANRKRFALLKEGAETPVEHVAPILKAADDWTVAYIVMAEPGAVEDGGMGAPGVEDVWEPDAIVKAAHSFLRAGGLTTGAHFMDEAVGKPVENFIAPVDFQLGEDLVKAGSWVLGFEPSTVARAQIDAGEFTGMSVEGVGWRMPVEVAKAALTTPARKALPDSAFAIPERRAYPIHTAGHAMAALGRVKANGTPGEKVRVVAAVKRRYPTMKVMALAKFNVAHVPAGSPTGGQFAVKGGGGGGSSGPAPKGRKGKAKPVAENAKHGPLWNLDGSHNKKAAKKPRVKRARTSRASSAARRSAATSARSQAKFARAQARAAASAQARQRTAATKAVKARIKAQSKASKLAQKRVANRANRKTKLGLRSLRAGVKADRKRAAAQRKAALLAQAQTRAATTARSQARTAAIATVRASSARAKAGPKANVLHASTVRSAKVVH